MAAALLLWSSVTMTVSIFGDFVTVFMPPCLRHHDQSFFAHTGQCSSHLDGQRYTWILRTMMTKIPAKGNIATTYPAHCSGGTELLLSHGLKHQTYIHPTSVVATPV